MARRETVIGEARKLAKDLTAKELATLIEAKEGEKMSGRASKDIRQWTLSELRRILELKSAEEKAVQKKEQESKNVRDRLECSAEKFRESEIFLQNAVRGKSEWTLGSMTELSPEQLLHTFDDIRFVHEEFEVPVHEASSGSLSLSSGKEGPPPTVPFFDQREIEKGRTTPVFIDSDRTPAWQSVAAAGVIAHANVMQKYDQSSIASDLAKQRLSVSSTNVIDEASDAKMKMQLAILFEIAEQGFEKTITTIVHQEADKAQLNRERFWLSIQEKWHSYQLMLDQHVTLMPPQSEQEAMERILVYLSMLRQFHMLIQHSDNPMEILGDDVIQSMARKEMNLAPRVIAAKEIEHLFPEYSSEFIHHPDVRFLRVGDKISFLAPFDLPSLPTTPQEGFPYYDLVMKQRIAVARPEIDLQSTEIDDWVCGPMYSKEELEADRLAVKSEGFKRNMMDSGRQMLRRLGNTHPAPEIFLRPFDTRWECKQGGVKHVIQKTGLLNANPSSMPISVDFDATDAFVRRIDYETDGQGSPTSVTMHPALSSHAWLGIDTLRHGHAEAAANSTLLQRAFPGVSTPLAASAQLIRELMLNIPGMNEELESIRKEAEETSDTTDPLWALKKLREPDFFLRSIRRLGLHITYSPIHSKVETVSRINVLGSLLTEGLIPGSSEKFYPYGLPQHIDSTWIESYKQDTDAMTERLYNERPVVVDIATVSPESADYLELFHTLGLKTEEMLNVMFVREGEALHFVCRTEDLPAHRIFRRAPHTNPERTFELLSADIKENHPFGENMWVSGSLPTVADLETELLQMQSVHERLLPPPAQEGKPDEAPESPVDVTGEGSDGNEDMPIPRLKAVRNALLRLGIGAEFVLDERTSAPTSHQYASAEPGHYVVVTIPAAKLQLLVSDDRSKGTRVIYNTLDPQHYTTIDLKKLDQELGPTRLRYDDAEQFTRIVISTIEQRVKDPSPVYPVDSAYPSPLDASPLTAEAIAALTRDFTMAAQKAKLEVHQLRVSDFSSIRSSETVWSFGGAACGDAYLDRLAREFGLHAASINRADAARRVEQSEASATKVGTTEAPVEQAVFRKTILRMILWEISKEYRTAQVARSAEADARGRFHSMEIRRPRRKKGEHPENPAN